MLLRPLVCLLALGLLAASAQAEVRFGDHVRIGGHDVSHQTFNRHRRGLFILHENKPNPEGCVWRRNGDGSKTKVCHYQVRR